MTIEALIFDFDGLILDTETPDFESWQLIYRQYGHEFPFDMWASIVGGTAASDFDPHTHLEELISQKLDRIALSQQRSKGYLNNIEQQSILPGVIDYLDEAERRNLRLAVASSSPQDWVHGHLKRLGIFERFHIIKTADDVKKTKPDPALFNAVLHVFELTPDESIVFEDSLNGIVAAKRAGLYCVAVPNPLTAQLDLSRADLQLASLADLSLGDLLKKVEA
jgi:HAD superfamily hydrolase (TIGR01509 family)